jgi:hypothetical protein
VAWLNLSQREKARVFVTAKTIAITSRSVSKRALRRARRGFKHTNQTQPNKMQPEDRNKTQHDPTNRLRIQGQPEEPLIRSIDMSSLRIRRLKHPISISRGSIDFIPPTQAHQSSSSNVFEVVEVDSQQDYRDDEDEDVVFAEVEAEEVG